MIMPNTLPRRVSSSNGLPRAACFSTATQCSVYEARPSTCDNFPHLVRGAGSLDSRMWQMIDRATYCPIVYNSLDSFKRETGFV